MLIPWEGYLCCKTLRLKTHYKQNLQRPFEAKVTEGNKVKALTLRQSIFLKDRHLCLFVIYDPYIFWTFHIITITITTNNMHKDWFIIFITEWNFFFCFIYRTLYWVGKASLRWKWADCNSVKVFPLISVFSLPFDFPHLGLPDTVEMTCQRKL